MKTTSTKQDLESLQDPLIWVIQTVWNPLNKAIHNMNLPVCLTPGFYAEKAKSIVNKQLQTSTKKELILTAIVVVLLTYILWEMLSNLISKAKKLTLADVMMKLPVLKGQLDKEVEKSRATMKSTLQVADPKFYKRLPVNGW